MHPLAARALQTRTEQMFRRRVQPFDLAEGTDLKYTRRNGVDECRLVVAWIFGCSRRGRGRVQRPGRRFTAVC